MSEQQLLPIHGPQPGNSPRRFIPAGKARQALLLAITWLAGGAGTLASCSDDNGRGPNSEMRVDPPAAAVETTAPPAAATASGADVEASVGALTGAGRKYRVAVETAYFFDKPEQSTPNGRYLRRGDTFFGEGETNGFVKTGFVQPDGSAGTAWLKVPELRPLAAGPATQPGRRSSSAPAARVEQTEGYGGELPPPGPRPGPAATPPGGTTTAVVQVGRSYFFNSPDLAVPRKAYCERGDKVRLGESRGEAVYVTFTNWEKVTTTGWMKKATLGIVNP